MKYNRTKKNNKKVKSKVMTIPKLRKAFEHIDIKTKHIFLK
jgi:hypothetical protein